MVKIIASKPSLDVEDKRKKWVLRIYERTNEHGGSNLQ